MKIEQFRFAADNLGYLIHAGTQGVVVDGGAPDAILSFAQKNNIEIKTVTNTHSHYDHTPGNDELIKKSQAQFLDCRTVEKDQFLELGGETLRIIHTPGHTNDSISFLADDFMVTGDTLFNGTVGNCFSGDLEAFFYSLKRLIEMPGNTKVFSGHDYVVESMEIAKQIEPENLQIDQYLKKYSPGYIVSTIGDELQVNPYIRFNAPAMIELLKQKNMPVQTELDRFKSIMESF